MKKLLIVVILVLVTSVAFASSVGAAGESWIVQSVDTIGCDDFDINLTTFVSGITTFPTNLRWRTIVDAGGLRYMDEDAGNPNNDGVTYFSIYTASTGGPTTAAFPIPDDTPITIRLSLIDGVGGPDVTLVTVSIDKCNGGTAVINNAVGVSSSCPYPLPSGSVVYGIPAGAPAFFAADLSAGTGFAINAGTWYISEFSGDFAKVWVACQASPVWVPSNAVAR